jgi:hypothetical protein
MIPKECERPTEADFLIAASPHLVTWSSRLSSFIPFRSCPAIPRRVAQVGQRAVAQPAVKSAGESPVPGQGRRSGWLRMFFGYLTHTLQRRAGGRGAKKFSDHFR